MTVPHPPAPIHVGPECPTCDGCGWLPNPYSGGPADYIPCPCCASSEARWTTADCLPVELFTEHAA
jgi:hypothetical protein